MEQGEFAGKPSRATRPAETLSRVPRTRPLQTQTKRERAGPNRTCTLCRLQDPAQFRIQRERKTRLLLRGLQATHERVDPNYGGPGDTPLVSVVPRGTGASGAVDPQTIKDPELRRAAFEKVLEDLLYDLRTGECRRFASGIALQRFLVFLKRVHRLH